MANWWLWCGHLEVEEGEQFVYSLLAPTDDLPFAVATGRYAVADGCVLVVRETVVPHGAGMAIVDAAAAGSIDLAPAGIALSVIPVGASRDTLEALLGHTAARLRANYGLCQPAWLHDAPTGALAGLLRILEDELGLPFAERFFGHIGNLDVVDFGTDAPNPPVAVAVMQGDPGRCVEVRRGPGWADEAMLAHVKASSGDELLADDLVALPAGGGRVEHSIPEETVALEVTLFGSGGGQRRFHMSMSMLANFSFDLEVQGRRLEIEDRLTRRMQGAGEVIAEQARGRTEHHRERTMVHAFDARIDVHAAALRSRFAAEAPEATDHFFDRTLVGEWTALDHFRHLLDHGDTTRAILVDPFFGDESLLRLIGRLRSSNLDLTVVTSWATTHPDTSLELAPDAADALDRNVARLQGIIDQMSGLLAPRLRLLNLVRGAGPAFHDRYLLLGRTDGPPVVYLLSNSVNGMAVHWPFCMSVLAGAAARRAADYVEGLARGEDITGEGDVRANFEWSGDAR